MLRPVSGGCWGEAREPPRLRSQGAFQWHGYPDPVSVETCCCAQTYSHRGIFGLCTKQIVNLQCGASVLRGRNAVCRRSLPCVRRVDGGTTDRPLWPEPPSDRLLKPGLQKRLTRRIDWGGKHLGCHTGLKRDCSADSVAIGWHSWRHCAAAPKGEPPPSATRGVLRGNPTRT